jgi:hypothetical protein
MNDHPEIPCKTCITKAICLNKKYIKCVLLGEYLKTRLCNHSLMHNRYNASYEIKRHRLHVDIKKNNEITIWRGYFPTYYAFKIELKFLYTAIQKMDNKFTFKKGLKWLKKIFRVKHV